MADACKYDIMSMWRRRQDAASPAFSSGSTCASFSDLIRDADLFIEEVCQAANENEYDAHFTDQDDAVPAQTEALSQKSEVEFEIEYMPSREMSRKISELFNVTLPEFENWQPGYFERQCCSTADLQFVALHDLDDQEEIFAALCWQEQQPLQVAELRYFAVSPSHQRKGLGKKLMNVWKEMLAERAFHFIVTYADNTAVDFYLKQDFVNKKDMILPQHILRDRIDRCNNASLMECNLQFHQKQNLTMDHLQRILLVMQDDLENRHVISVRQMNVGNYVGKSLWRTGRVLEICPELCWLKSHTGWCHISSNRIRLEDRYSFSVDDPTPAPLPENKEAKQPRNVRKSDGDNKRKRKR